MYLIYQIQGERWRLLLLERLLSAPSAARSSLSSSQPPRKAPSVRSLRSMLGLTLRTRRWRGASCTHPASPQRALSTPQASKRSARTWQPPPSRGVVESRRPGCLRARAGAGTGTVPGVRGLLPRPASPQERRGAAEGPCARAAPPRNRAPDTAGPVGGARGSGRSRARFYLAQGPGGGAGAGSAAEPADGRGRSRRGNAAGSSRRPRRR